MVMNDTLIAFCSWLGVPPSYVLDAQLPGDQALPHALTAMIKLEPRLDGLLGETLERMERGEINEEAVLDVIRYVNYRLGFFDKEK